MLKCGASGVRPFRKTLSAGHPVSGFSVPTRRTPRRVGQPLFLVLIAVSGASPCDSEDGEFWRVPSVISFSYSRYIDRQSIVDHTCSH